NGLPNGTTVTLDVDKNNDGNFTDPGESNYASGTLTNGWATLTLPALSALGTYPMRAHATDLAGHLATSALATVVVASDTAWAVTGQVLSALPQGDAVSQLGDVGWQHALDLDQSPGTSQAGNPALVYNSDAVNVRPVVQVTIPTDDTQAL